MKRVDFPFGWVHRPLFAGPYADKPADCIGLKLAPEVVGRAQFLLPIKDFDVPDPYRLYEGLGWALRQMALGRKVYVGCKGGMGRTGLFLACMAKTLGVTDKPVEWVRKVYNPWAVETKLQEKFVDFHDFRDLRYEAKLSRGLSNLNVWRRI